jgi:hypothetical protein
MNLWPNRDFIYNRAMLKIGGALGAALLFAALYTSIFKPRKKKEGGF